MSNAPTVSVDASDTLTLDSLNTPKLLRLIMPWLFPIVLQMSGLVFGLTTTCHGGGVR